jgi:hypothetical protein
MFVQYGFLCLIVTKHKLTVQTVAIDVCLYFYEAVIVSSTYFRFLFVILN